MISSPEITLRDIYIARRRIRGHVIKTPMRRSEWLSSTGADVRLKLESVQLTNSFKVRGAMNAALRLIEGDSPPVIVTASAGNHGRALALAAHRLGLSAIVFTPASAPETKKAAIRRLGATLQDNAPDYDAAERMARDYANEFGATYISPYNHPDVIAGAGTIGIEILESFPATDVVLIPMGGGGLASGVGVALKRAAPHVTVVGVEVAASRPFAIGFERGGITEIEVRPSLADGLIGNLEPGSITFDLVRQHVDRLVSVTEDDLRRALRGLAGEEHVIAEGAGAAATAAVLGTNAVHPGQRAVVLVTGANIDLATFTSAIHE
jgi:threonine dehydratase